MDVLRLAVLGCEFIDKVEEILDMSTTARQRKEMCKELKKSIDKLAEPKKDTLGK